MHPQTPSTLLLPTTNPISLPPPSDAKLPPSPPPPPFHKTLGNSKTKPNPQREGIHSKIHSPPFSPLLPFSIASPPPNCFSKRNHPANAPPRSQNPQKPNWPKHPFCTLPIHFALAVPSSRAPSPRARFEFAPNPNLISFAPSNLPTSSYTKSYTISTIPFELAGFYFTNGNFTFLHPSSPLPPKPLPFASAPPHEVVAPLSPPTPFAPSPSPFLPKRSRMVRNGSKWFQIGLKPRLPTVPHTPHFRHPITSSHQPLSLPSQSLPLPPSFPFGTPPLPPRDPRRHQHRHRPPPPHPRPRPIPSSTGPQSTGGLSAPSPIRPLENSKSQLTRPKMMLSRRYSKVKNRSYLRNHASYAPQTTTIR